MVILNYSGESPAEETLYTTVAAFTEGLSLDYGVEVVCSIKHVLYLVVETATVFETVVAHSDYFFGAFLCL